MPDGQARAVAGVDPGPCVTRPPRVVQKQKETRPNEHEVVAYLVIPLLRALGWSETQLAIE